MNPRLAEVGQAQVQKRAAMAESRISFPGPRSLRSPFPSVIPPAPQNSRGGFSAPPDGGALQLHAPGCFSDQLPETPELQFGVLAAAQAGDSLFQPTVALQREETAQLSGGQRAGPPSRPGPPSHSRAHLPTRPAQDRKQEHQAGPGEEEGLGFLVPGVVAQWVGPRSTCLGSLSCLGQVTPSVPA